MTTLAPPSSWCRSSARSCPCCSPQRGEAAKVLGLVVSLIVFG